MNIEVIEIKKIVEYENNAKIHTKEQIEQIKKSILEFGFNDPIAVDENNIIIEGHGRLYALKDLGYKEIDCIRLTHLDEQQKKAYILAHNKLTMNTGFEFEMLQSELKQIDNFNMTDFGFEISEEYFIDKIKKENDTGNFKKDFIVAPLSVFDARKKEWQDRKKEWKDIGLESEVGREQNLAYTKHLNGRTLKGTSIFDPVVCEICYTWFIPRDSKKIIDCFAGGSVRGVVAERLGFEYIGIDLRNEQIEANYNNAKKIGCDLNKITWICDNSKNIDIHVENETQDLMFTCPPYFNLEVYSDNPEDISNMNYEDFKKDYNEILIKTANKLKDNRFAIVVISNIRNKKGEVIDLVGDTIQSMKQAGLSLYNELILVGPPATAFIVARRYMKNRKVVKTHQNILIFYKGDTTKIKEHFDEIKNVDFEYEEQINE